MKKVFLTLLATSMMSTLAHAAPTTELCGEAVPSKKVIVSTLANDNLSSVIEDFAIVELNTKICAMGKYTVVVGIGPKGAMSAIILK